MSYVVSLFEVADKLNDLVIDQAKWSQETFGSDSGRGPLGPLDHLTKEVEEAKAAWKATINEEGAKELAGPNRAKFREEMADCFLLLLDAMRRGQMKFGTLLTACEEKMMVNKARKWPEPQPDIAVEHIED